MQKHLIKQVFIAIWMRWLVERKKNGKSLHEIDNWDSFFLCVDFFEVWPYQQHIFDWILYHFLIQSQESNHTKLNLKYSRLGPLHRIIWNFRFRIQLFPRIIQHAWTFFWIFNCTISGGNFQCWICCFFSESELKFCSYKREKWTLVKLLQNKYH